MPLNFSSLRIDSKKMPDSTETSSGESPPEALDGTTSDSSKDEEPTLDLVVEAVPATDSDAYDTDLDIEDEMPKAYTSMTSRDIYLRSCEQLGVVPASYFLANMTKPSLNMSHHGLGPLGAKAISPPLVVNTSILDLNIEDNWITSEGVKDIAEMLLENCYIANLNMSQNKLGSKGAQHVCDMLMENTTLRSVNLSANEFKDRDAMYFADAFRANFKLKEFDLSKNAFCELGGEWLGQAIAANESIEYLNLSWNHLRLKGALAVCAGMKINITIKQLDVSWNGFANEGAAAMAEALKTNNTLTWLDLSHNRITGEGAVLLAKALLVNDTLRTLKIGENPIDAESALALLRAIAENERSAMEDLDITGVNVSEEFKLLARELAQRNRSSASRTSFRYNVNRTEDMRTDFDSCGLDSNPMDLLQDFLEKKRLRLIDLFRNFDKDLSWKISPAEFKKGIANAGIRMSRQQLRNLMSNLDYDVDGQVNYKELMTGKKEAMLRKREERRRRELEEKLKRAEQERFLDAWNHAIKKASSPNSSPRGSPTASPRGSRPSSARRRRSSLRPPKLSKQGSPRFIDGNVLAVEPVTAMQKYDPSSSVESTGSNNHSPPINPPRPRTKIPLESSKRVSIPSLTLPIKYNLRPAMKSTGD